MRPKTRSAISAGSSRPGVMMPSSRKPTSAILPRICKWMSLAPGALGEPDEIFQNFRRGSGGNLFVSGLEFLRSA